LQAWLAGLWESTQPEELLLADSAERLLWREIIVSDRAVEGEPGLSALFDLAALADSAAEAWKRICEWGEPPARARELTAETRAFARWQAAFTKRCRENGWRSRAELARLVAGAFEESRLPVPESIAFVGFRSSSPALERMFAALRGAGAVGLGDFLWIDPACESGRIDYVRYACLEDEVRAVAASIRRTIVSRPDIRIGVVAADLSAYRDAIERIFTVEFDPGALLAPGEPHTRSFDLAGAPSLGEYPMIADALDLLALRERGNRFDLLSRVLLSPYPRELVPQPDETAERNDLMERGAGSEHNDATVSGGGRKAVALAEQDRHRRARLEAQLRSDNRARVDLGGSGGLITGAERAGAVGFAERLKKLRSFLVQDHRLSEDPAPSRPLSPVRHSPKAWGDIFIARLRAMGWPGTGALFDSERVLFGAWREAVAELASLGRIRANMSETEALAWLRDLCSRRLVQSPSPGLQVQAMGLLDAAGLSFDRLYVLGLDSSALPALPRPHPLLPAAWQRQQRMPFSSAELELELASGSWRELCASAPEVQVSVALQGDGGEDLLPSALVADGFAKLDGVETAPDPWYLPEAGARAERVEERPSEGATQGARVFRGGTGLIRDQSQCPFRAMARRRLAAEPLAELETEPTAATRGKLAHRCLEAIWGELRTGAALKALDETALSSLCARATETVVAGYPAAVISPALRPSVTGWLAQTVRAWLVYERRRLGDWEVTVREGEVGLTLDAGDGRRLKLEHIRIDRVDRLADGGVFVIDYKTGAKKLTCSAWRGERPEEPQLPLYVLALRERGDDVRAAAFANLGKLDDMGFRATPEVELFPADGGDTGGKPRGWEGWADEIVSAKASLEVLAAAYLDGHAEVDPKRIATSCRYCGLESLCRVSEQATGEGIENGRDDAEEERV